MSISESSPGHLSAEVKTPYFVYHLEQNVDEHRSPYDPITITDSYALMALTIGAMMNERPAELVLLDLIDTKAQEFYEDLGRDMVRLGTYVTREEHEALLQPTDKQPNGKQASAAPS